MVEYHDQNFLHSKSCLSYEENSNKNNQQLTNHYYISLQKGISNVFAERDDRTESAKLIGHSSVCCTQTCLIVGGGLIN